jgi:hypothetical protein
MAALLFHLHPKGVHVPMDTSTAGTTGPEAGAAPELAESTRLSHL